MGLELLPASPSPLTSIRQLPPLLFCFPAKDKTFTATITCTGSISSVALGSEIIYSTGEIATTILQSGGFFRVIEDQIARTMPRGLSVGSCSFIVSGSSL